MARRFRKPSKKVGSPPGTLVHLGEKKTDQVHISLIQYNTDTVIEQPLPGIDAAHAAIKNDIVTWINIDGIHDTESIARVGQHFGIHPLTLEDVLNTYQRPKSEIFDNYLFVVLRMLNTASGDDLFTSEQISLILMESGLITFQEAPGDVFSPIRERIRQGKGRIRSAGCDYLAYALVDAVVDNYFIVLEKMGEQLEALEEKIDQDPGPEVLEGVHTIRRELIGLRKQVWPLREIVSRLTKEEVALITPATALFMRDVYDHTIQAIDTIESYRDILAGLQDLYLSIVSNRMNEVMKVLTIIATIFIPITFVAGIYGMNFTHMPELAWRWGYPLFWLVTVAIVVVLILFFKRKKWL